MLQSCALQACKVWAFWKEYCADCPSLIPVHHCLYPSDAAAVMWKKYLAISGMREAVTATSLLEQTSDTIYEWH